MNIIQKYSVPLAVLATALLIGTAILTTPAAAQEGEYTMCTMDAMQCPDGTWVGRSGPNCEFVCGGASVDVGVGVDGSVGSDIIGVEGDAGAGVSAASSGQADVQIAPGPGMPIGDILMRIIQGSSAVTDAEVSVESDTSIGAERGEVSANSHADVEVNWFAAFVAALHNFFFGWWGNDGGIGTGTGTGSISADATFTAAPTSGAAPLTVRFSSALTEPAQYTVNFGDSTSAQYEVCGESYPYQCSISHTYSAKGTYTAQLIYDICPANGEGCLAPVQIVKSITITVR